MKKIIALALVATSFAAFGAPTASFATDAAQMDRLCGPDAPEGYKRPGGYCEQIGSNKSLVEDKDGCDYYYVPTLMSLEDLDKPLLVAENCYPVLL